MNDTSHFSIVPDAEADAIRQLRHKGANGKWAPVVEALGRGAVVLVDLGVNSIHTTIGRPAKDLYPTKRLATRASDDPRRRYVWLVDR